VRPRRTAALLAIAVPLLACAGTPPAEPGVDGSRLPPCPSSPNCVSSDATDARHAVAPFVLSAPAPEAWRAALAAVAELPRTTIVAETSDSLHAECRSALFRFVDDLDLQLRAAEGIIAVRSASRVGYGDLGVNRSRVETLRGLLTKRGVIE
jgi:uncharacterized protein (DUF1499 family)